MLMNSKSVRTGLPDRTHTDIPIQVRYILSVCEVATSWGDWQTEHHNEPRAHFCEGVFDYWWDDELQEPRWEMIFNKDLKTGELSGIPTKERFYYQQGAMFGYRLREEFKNNE